LIVFILRRVLSGLLLVALLSFLTFFTFNEVPTSPACLVVACGPKTTTTDAMYKAAEHQLGIDRPVLTQYGDWVWHVVRDGDFGDSWTTKTAVGSSLADALPVTLSLVGGGMLLMLLLAIPLGSFAATRPRTLSDRGILAVSVIGLAIHPFVLGSLISEFFAVHLNVYSMYCPLTGANATPTGSETTGFSIAPACGGPIQWAGHLAVPWLVFALLFLPFYMRMIRVRLLETYSEPYISTARAKGASEGRVLGRHAMRNAFGPLLPMLAIDAGTAITAAIYVETVFGLQGLGALAVGALSGAAGGYDLPLIVAIVSVVGAFVVLLNVASDVLGAWLDPRIRQRRVSGLVPLPRSIAARPRVRLALNVGVAGALVALVVVVVASKPKRASGLVTLGLPVQVHKVGWEDYTRMFASIPGNGQTGTVGQTGVLEVDTRSVEVGPLGWRVHAKIVNNSPLRVRIVGIAPAGTPASYPNVPFSLVVQTDSGSGIKQLEPLPASQIDPPLAQILGARQTWQGTFAGSGVVAKGQLFFAGYGQFFYADSPVQTQAFSVVSRDSARG
jgi:peptide/nickel transport system permease protein